MGTAESRKPVLQDRQPLRMAWIGFHMEGVPALKALLDAGIRFEGIATLRAEQLATRSASADYEQLLADYEVLPRCVKSLNDPQEVGWLQGLDLDVAFVIGWSQILSPEVLASARLGMIGAHASLLPHNRGSAPINWAILKGEKMAGNTLIWLSAGVDEGEIIDQIEFPITPYDTCATLYEKVAETNREMIMRTVRLLFRGERPGRPQAHTQEPLLPRRRPADGEIRWAAPAAEVYDFIRGLTRPYPGAFSSLEGERWTIWDAALLPDWPGTGYQPGEVIGPVYSPVETACGLAVACDPGAVVLLDLEGPNDQVLHGSAVSDLPWKAKVWTYAEA